jgi:nicotinamide-nucleotide amidase
MNAQIISIGDELLIGQTINNNAAYIGQQLDEIQINVNKIIVVGDKPDAILREFELSYVSSDLVITTGGLGPTHDDYTRECVVKFFNTELVMNFDVLDDIKKMFAKRGRELTKINENQALVPKIATTIRNENGTAPGYWIEQSDKIFIVLPGVPYEMKAMMESFVIPRLQQTMPMRDRVRKRKILQTTGIPESLLFERLGSLDELLEGAQLAFLPSQFGVKLRITVEESNDEAAQNKLVEIEQKIRTKAGRYIFGQGDDTLQQVIARLLRERGMKIAIAESCTGGYVSNLLTNISGSSHFFERGIIAYSNAAKVEILKVDEDTIVRHGAVSLDVARQMAEGVKSISGADIGISITGIMGPTGATADKPIGLVYIGYYDDKVCTAKKFVFGEDRILNKQRTAQAALDMIRRFVLGISIDE